MFENENLTELYNYSLIFSLLHILDVLSTIIFMKMGAVEGNFIPALVFEMIGFNAGVIVVTVSFSLLLGVSYWFCRIKEVPYAVNLALLLGIFLKGFIVIDNLRFIMKII